MLDLMYDGPHGLFQRNSSVHSAMITCLLFVPNKKRYQVIFGKKRYQVIFGIYYYSVVLNLLLFSFK
jgi:hypothetical protein